MEEKMITREKVLPTRASKTRCFLLIGLLIFLYVFENSSITTLIDSWILNYIIKPGLWIGLAYLVWIFPKIRAKGLLKLKGTLCWWAFYFGVIYIVVSFIAGVIDGLGKSPYSHSPIGIITNVLLVGSVLVGREFVRSYLVNSITKKENFLIFTLIALFMTIISISFNKYTNIDGNIELVELIAEYFAPEFSLNLFASYLVFLGGPLLSIIYLGIIQGFHWFSPILPDLQWITKALIGVLCPIFCLMFLQNIYMKESKKIKRKDKDEENPISWVVTCIVSIGIIWFSVGVFPVYPSVIATGSMEPMIKPGDVILIKKIDGNTVKIGDVIQFKRGSILISHRVIDIIEDEEKGKSYKTKGDNNSGPDVQLVKPEEIKGEIKYVVPKIGWPTLLLKSKKDAPLEEVEF